MTKRSLLQSKLQLTSKFVKCNKLSRANGRARTSIGIDASRINSLDIGKKGASGLCGSPLTRRGLWVTQVKMMGLLKCISPALIYLDWLVQR